MKNAVKREQLSSLKLPSDSILGEANIRHPSGLQAQGLWLWAGVIVAIKIVNQISALAMCGRCCFPHTLVNKITGFLLFIAVPMTFCTVIPIAIVAAIATFAAIHEYYIITNKNIQCKDYDSEQCSTYDYEIRISNTKRL